MSCCSLPTLGCLCLRVKNKCGWRRKKWATVAWKIYNRGMRKTAKKKHLTSSRVRDSRARIVEGKNNKSRIAHPRPLWEATRYVFQLYPETFVLLSARFSDAHELFILIYTLQIITIIKFCLCARAAKVYYYLITSVKKTKTKKNIIITREQL